MTTSAVTQYRHRNGIAASRSAKEAAPAAPVAGKAPAAAPVAGKAPAAPVATQAPAAPVATQAPAAPAATQASAPAPASALTSYKVDVRGPEGDRRFVVVGATVVDAVARAMAALEARSDGPWAFRAIRASHAGLA